MVIDYSKLNIHDSRMWERLLLRC